MAYYPLGRVEAWSATSPGPVELPVLHASVTRDRNQYITTAEFSVIIPYDTVLDDYAAFASNLYQKGTLIKITVTEDGNFSGALHKHTFWGSITEVVRDPLEDDNGSYQVITCKCQCPFQKARVNGINMSRQTRILTTDVSFSYLDFDAADPLFLANIPLDSLVDTCEYVPRLIVNLRGEYLDLDGNLVTHNYNKDEFTYAAALHQIYFQQDQQALFSVGGILAPGPDWVNVTWYATLYYYDPLDLTNTAVNILDAIAEGVVWSGGGGLGFTPSEVDLDDILGFGSSPKVIRSVLREKIDGPIVQFFDELREAGIVPANYYIGYDAAMEQMVGRYLWQDNAAAVLPANGVLDYSRTSTMEGLAGRCEHYGLAITPENVAAGAAVTLNEPAGYSILPVLGAPPVTGNEIVDGNVGTMVSFQLTGTGMAGYQAIRSANDAMLIDLLSVKEIRKVMFKAAPPISDELASDEWPRGVPLIRYDSPANRNAKITISASVDLIDASNPGIPINDDCVAYELDATNTEDWHDWDCTNIHQARYIAIRWEQDGFYKTSNSSGKVYRTSFMGCEEIKVLGDGRLRYKTLPFPEPTVGHPIYDYDHPAKGEVPFVEVKGASQVTTVADVTNTQVFALTNSAFATTGDFIQVKHGTNNPVLTRVASVHAGAITVWPPVPAVAPGDAVGEWNRWVYAFDGTWHDTYYPKLREKLENTTDWLEILDDSQASDFDEAVQLCLDRLEGMYGIEADYRMEIPLDVSLDIGSTVKTYTDEEPWLIDRVTWNINNAGQADSPGVTMQMEGTNYWKAPQ